MNFFTHKSYLLIDAADIRNKLIELDLHAPSPPPLGRRVAQVGRRSLRRCLRCSAVLAVPDHARRRVVLSSSHRERRPPASCNAPSFVSCVVCVHTRGRSFGPHKQSRACARACAAGSLSLPAHFLRQALHFYCYALCTQLRPFRASLLLCLRRRWSDAN